MESESNSSEESPKSRKEALKSLPSFWDGGDDSGAQKVNGEPDVTAELSIDRIREATSRRVATASDTGSNATDSTVNLKAANAGESVSKNPSPEHGISEAAPSPQPTPSAAAQPVSAPQPVRDYEPTASTKYQEPDRLNVGKDFISAGAQPVMTPMSQTKRGGRGALLAVICVLGILLVVYVGVSVYFSSHFLPNTTVNGDDVSGKAHEELAARITNTGMAYQTHVTGDGIDLQIAGKDVGVSYDGAAYAQAAAKQYSGWTWPVAIFQSRELKVEQGVTLNEELLRQSVSPAIENVNESATPPTNASIQYDASSGKFVETKEALGTQINRDAAIASIKSGIQALHEQITLGDQELVQPTLRSGDKALNDSLTRANEIVTKSIPLRVAGTDAMVIDGKQLSQWLSVNEKGEVSLKSDEVMAWTQGELSSKFDTVASKRTYTRPDGKVIEVEGGDLEYSYGWNVDGETLAQAIINNVKSNNFQPIDVPMLQEAAKWNPGGQEWPNRYVDVDITEQTVRMYDENSNVIVETLCVSGDPARDGGTHRGVFYIYNKASPMDLVGADENGDGQPDYIVPVVFWMPFDGGEGLHDVSTRSAWGGDVYTYSGSHGCVNLPYSAAAELWENTEVGTVVVVHD